MSIRSLCSAAVFGILVSFSSGLQAADAPASKEPSREADRAAILQTARDFTAAYAKADAKAVAALWTEQGEYESDDGPTLRGRSAIEAAFATHFKSQPAGKMEIKVESIRFPSRDTAFEEGLTCTIPGGGLPESARYRVLHVREDGKWRIALCREWGANESRLIDLDWLLGSWKGQVKDQEMTISFSRDKDAPFIVGEFTTTAADKATSMGTMKIGIDPASRQFMSWHFDPDGGHGHGVWLRERNHWAVDSQGIQGDGTETAGVNILTRFGDDELGWRSIDRKADGKPLPDAALIRLKRVSGSK